ncbi:MAG TPA: helix-turn-helix domain-containing protein [Terriglobales bacterium]|nr:helix-turn-helix domain-containing protein [Terriglobales bacterium]
MKSAPAGDRTRIRRQAERAREEILDAAERRLVADGPAALRVQAVAREVGVTDPAVHYHFGSREALLQAVMRRAARRLRDDVVDVLARWEPEPGAVVELAELLRVLYTGHGYARLTAWLSLDGWRPSGSGLLRAQAEALHQRRAEMDRSRGAAAPDLLDTLFSLALLNVAVWSEPLITEAVLAMFGLPGDEAGVERFRQWLAHLVAGRLAAPA